MALFTKETPAPKTSNGKLSADVVSPGIAFVGPNIVFDGTLTGTEDLLIEGKFSGNIKLESDLRIGPHAKVEATVHARNVTVEGSLTGDVSADNRVELSHGSNVDGNIKAPKIVVSEGARFRGTVDMLSSTTTSGDSQPHRKKGDRP